VTMLTNWYDLPAPATWSPHGRRTFARFAAALRDQSDPNPPAARTAMQAVLRSGDLGIAAAAQVAKSLVDQGWSIRVDRGRVSVSPPSADDDVAAEKARVRRQELLKRDEQLSEPSVRRFVADMEKPREFNGALVSVFNLMRDGGELADRLRVVLSQDSVDPHALRKVVDPYIQLVHTGERCEHTGLRLNDIWRYFRHTWTNQYTSTPGRTMLVLVRDRAADFHPVIGIAALGSAIVQISERDEWIGWQPEQLLRQLDEAPSVRMARWIVARLEQGLTELHIDDLIEDGLYWPTLWDSPSDDAIERLLKEADVKRREHHRYARPADFKDKSEPDWVTRAESELFRSKRCLALAELLRARKALTPFLYPTPSISGLKRALENPAARRSISAIARRAKGESVGTEIADLTVCGAVAPYNSLLGGKLVSMLAVSPTIVREYHKRYGIYASQIASSLAGRPIRRRSNLVFVGTTSLYGSGASQYNRIIVPANVLDGKSATTFRRLGRSRSFGTAHLSSDSVKSLVQLAEQSAAGARVNSIFGEGVNPKLRKIRAGLDLLGWPSEQLLQHRRPRIIYGVNLVTNLLPYLLGVDEEPKYIFRRGIRDDARKITDWWYERWLVKRIRSTDIIAKVASHTLIRPVRHGARVVLPEIEPTDN
jgi:hypothetical protein